MLEERDCRMQRGLVRTSKSLGDGARVFVSRKTERRERGERIKKNKKQKTPALLGVLVCLCSIKVNM